ncbi:MAG: TetR/AcrR family transcriptional regulator [Terriglobales bacterium]
MGTKERRERERLETRDLILEAARELFLTEGYEGVTMRKVADKIEYSPTAIYVHFADKEDLFRELCHADFAKLASAFQQIGQQPDPVQRLRLIGQAYIEFGLHYPNHYKLMFMTPHCPAGLTERDREVKGNPEKDAYAFLKHTVEELIERRLIKDGLTDAELISQTLWAGVHGVISLHIAKHDDVWLEWTPLEQRAQTMLDALLGGLLKEK